MKIGNFTTKTGEWPFYSILAFGRMTAKCFFFEYFVSKSVCVCVCVIQVFGKIAIAILSYGFVAPLKYKYYFHCHRCFFVLIFFLLGFLCVFVLLRALENTAICTLKVKFSHIKTKPFQCK